MNLRKSFNFKVKEVIGYTEHYDGDPEEEDDVSIISIDVYLSGGQIITIDISEENYDPEDLQEILGYDPNYWDEIYSEETNTRSITKEIKDRKPIKTYNPYE